MPGKSQTELGRSPSLKRERKGARGARKVKTGCLTCKIRHKKCDERKPACTQCTSTGRKCDLLAPSGPLLRQPGAKPWSLADEPRGATPLHIMDVWHFEYFRVVCVKELSNYLGTTLWETLVLRAALSESCILNGVLALGAISRNATPSTLYGRPAFAPGFPVGYSLRKYNLAIRELHRRLATTSSNWELAVLGSIIFNAIESLQGNYDVARMHLRGALAIAKSQSSQATANTAPLLDAISRLDGRFFHPPQHLELTPPQLHILPLAFSSISQARDALNLIVGAIKSLLWRRKGEGHPTPKLPLSLDWVQNLSRLSLLLESWYSLFSKFIADHIMDVKTMTCNKVLLIHYHVSRISALTDLYQTETAYDVHLSNFSLIIDLATQVLDVEKAAHNSPFQPKQSHPYHIAVVQPLFLVACKCRDRVLRRKAVQAMERVTGDGFHDTRLLTRVAKWVITKEENLIAVQGSSTGVIEEEDRLHDVELDFGSEALPCRVSAWKRLNGGERVVVHATLDGETDLALP